MTDALKRELEEFEAWWNEDDDIPNDGPWNNDTPIQFAWAAWQARAALSAPQPAAPEPATDGEKWCLNCDKAGHATNECYSTHGLKLPGAQPLKQLTEEDVRRIAREEIKAWLESE